MRHPVVISVYCLFMIGDASIMEGGGGGEEEEGGDEGD